MRIPQQRNTQGKSIKKVLILGLLLASLAGLWATIKDVGQTTFIESDELIIAKVEKGDLVRGVRAPGSLVPIELNFVAAASAGKVEQIYKEAGDEVDQGTVIMVLDNPQLVEALDTAKIEVESLLADYFALKQRLSQDMLRQRIILADFNARYEMAKLKKKAYESLLETGAASDINYNESALLEEQLSVQHSLEVERLESLPDLHQAQLAAANARVQKAQRQLTLQQQLIDDLTITAKGKGVLQEVLLEKGEQVAKGTILARVAGQNNLKAELRVQESQVKYVKKGQVVEVTADGKSAQGIVKRIDPAVQQGTVLVDVFFSGESLFGARPDLRVEGVIELEHIKGVLKIKRPVFSREFASGSLFVLNTDGTRAYRQQVNYGRGSVDLIEIISELEVGDRVIISNTNKFDQVSEIAIR